MEVKKGVGGFTVFSHVAPKKRVFFIFRFLLFSPQAWAREAPTNRSTSAMVNPLAILYGSETGTAQVRQKKAKLSAGLSYFLLVPTERLHRGAHPRRSVSGAPHNSEADCISHAQKKYPRLSLSVVDSLRCVDLHRCTGSVDPCRTNCIYRLEESVVVISILLCISQRFQEVAEYVAGMARRRGFDAAAVALDSVPIPQVLESPLAVFVVSTTGDGEVPSNMSTFWRFLLRR